MSNKPQLTTSPYGKYKTPSGRPHKVSGVGSILSTKKWINRQLKHHTIVTVKMSDTKGEYYRWFFDHADKYYKYDTEFESPTIYSDGWVNLEGYD